MGWDYTYRERGVSHLAWFRRHVYGDALIDITSVGTTLYGAYRYEDAVHGVVILTRRAPKSEWNFGYKTVPETWGPFETDCPERILDLLSPTTDEVALDWRAKCRESIAKRKARPRLTRGAVVRFLKPLDFTDGSTHDTFMFVKGSTFTRGTAWGSRRYQISGWNKREYEVMPGPDFG